MSALEIGLIIVGLWLAVAIPVAICIGLRLRRFDQEWQDLWQ